MSMNPDKCLNTLPNSTFKSDQENYNSNPDKWINTLPKKNVNRPLKNYSITLILFIAGLIFVSVIKNQTRDLQKEINNLTTSINVLKYELHKVTLDHEIITSPENISFLAKEHLDNDLTNYARSQIKDINNITEKNTNTINVSKNESQKLAKVVQLNISKKIKEKKGELKELQKIYSNPKRIPDEVKLHVSKKIEKTKFEIRQLYENPKGVISNEKIKNWALVQVVKVFFGIPIIPGK